MEDLREKIRALAEEVLGGSGVWVVDVETGAAGRRQVVRLFIDKPGGVTVGDCAHASRAMEDALDTREILPGSYVLEVSSPGLERPLRHPEEYEHFIGRRVRIVTRVPVAEQQALSGEIVEVTPAMVALRLPEGDLLSLPYEAIASAHLDAALWAKPDRPGRAGKQRKKKASKRRV
jgi:ribosome maturation factor RimP